MKKLLREILYLGSKENLFAILAISGDIFKLVVFFPSFVSE